MKRIHTLYFLLFCISVDAQVSIDSFYQKGTVWTGYGSLGYNIGGAGHDCIGAIGYEWEIGDDTTIGNITYRKLYYRQVGGYDNCAGVFGPKTNKEYIGRLRVTGRKVYVTSDKVNGSPAYQTGTEYQLYDFDLKAGDTIHSSLYEYSDRRTLVSSIDTIQTTAGIVLNKYNLEYHDTSGNVYGAGYLLEGIGSLYHLNIFFFEPPITNRRILCYNSQTLFYKFPVNDNNTWGTLLNTCWDMTALNVNEISQLTSQPYQVYPNPLSGEELININGTKNELHSCILYDINGRKLYQLDNVVPKNGHISLNIELASGIYVLTLKAHNGAIFNRTIVKR